MKSLIIRVQRLVKWNVSSGARVVNVVNVVFDQRAGVVCSPVNVKRFYSKWFGSLLNLGLKKIKLYPKYPNQILN